MTIDLHTHSTASDGTDRPADLVAKAAAAGLDIMAITDHDTTGGWDEATASLPDGLTLVPGAEFSCMHCDSDGQRVSLHLLGYLFDPDHDGLRAERARLRVSRLGRGRAIVDNLAADGVPIDLESGGGGGRGGAVGRPHIARVLVENGVVSDVNDAFRRTAVLRLEVLRPPRTTARCSTPSDWYATRAVSPCSPIRSPGAGARWLTTW